MKCSDTKLIIIYSNQFKVENVSVIILVIISLAYNVRIAIDRSVSVKKDQKFLGASPLKFPLPSLALVAQSPPENHSSAFSLN